MSHRTEKVASSIRQWVAEIIREELSDPRISRLTSVTRVEVAPDLSSAHLYFSTIGTAGEQRTSMAGLQHARKRIQVLVAKRLHTRLTPELIFHEDLSIKRGDETLRLINEAMAEIDRDSRRRQPDAPGEQSPAAAAERDPPEA